MKKSLWNTFKEVWQGKKQTIREFEKERKQDIANFIKSREETGLTLGQYFIIFFLIIVLLLGLWLKWHYYSPTPKPSPAKNKILTDLYSFKHLNKKKQIVKKKSKPKPVSKVIQKPKYVSEKPKSVTYQAPPTPPVKEIAYNKVVETWGANEWQAFETLIYRESGWQPYVYNRYSGACGLFQALPCSKMGGMEINNQINWGVGYIKNRYGSPTNALNFHYSHNWY